MLSIYDLRCEYSQTPLFVDNPNPVFSWKLKSDNLSVFQVAYRLVIDGIYDSGRVESGNSAFIEYKGTSLSPETKYSYCVTVWDNHGEEASASGRFITGLLSPDLFEAKFIESDGETAIFCRHFKIEEPICAAYLYATCYGVYDAYINGKRVGDAYLAPGFISYNKRLEYQSYDITDMLSGQNAIGITVGEGWCRSRLRWNGDCNRTKPYFGRKCALAAQIIIVYESGRRELICTDNTWKELPSEIVYSDIYNGEICDASLIVPYSDPAFCLDEYPCASVSDYTTDHIVCGTGLPVRIIEEIKPIEIIHTPNGETVVDFGVNMVGWAEFTAYGNPGDRVVIDHAEVLDGDGNFYMENMRFATNEVIYTFANEGKATFHPRFTFQGFRYVRVKEFPGEVSLDSFRGLVIHSDLRRIGNFECSDERVNRLYENIIRGQVGNSVDIPTDCPQRDERGGWTGDTQIFNRAFVRNFESPKFFEKWLHTMSADQYPDGMITDTVPDFDSNHIACGYGDACTMIPWEIYMQSGDLQLLARQYSTMKKWIDYVKNQGDNELLWNTGEHYGDWLAMDDRSCFGNQTDSYDDRSINEYSGATEHYFMATAFFSHSAHLTALTARELGFDDEAQYYEKLSSDIKIAFAKEYLDENEDPKIKTQTAYVLMLKFGLVKDEKKAAAKLNKLVADNGNRLTTGILGYGDLCPMLTKYGYADTAYSLLLQTGCPSWLYAVERGATTVWEHWDSLKEDGSFCNPDMNSFNHPTFGNIGMWMYTDMAGIYPTKPGYKEFVIAPVHDGENRINYVKASINTPYGRIASSWTTKDGKTEYIVEVPENTIGTFVYPDGRKEKLVSGKYKF